MTARYCATAYCSRSCIAVREMTPSAYAAAMNSLAAASRSSGVVNGYALIRRDDYMDRSETRQYLRGPPSPHEHLSTSLATFPAGLLTPRESIRADPTRGLRPFPETGPKRHSQRTELWHTIPRFLVGFSSRRRSYRFIRACDPCNSGLNAQLRPSVPPPRTHSALSGRPSAGAFQGVRGFLVRSIPKDSLTTDQKVENTSSSGG